MKRIMLGLAAGLVLVACGTPAPPPSATYEPVPDETLFAQVRALPGVTSADLGYSDSFGHTGYSGTVTVSAATDPKKVLDETLAILWQGRPGAAYNIKADNGGPVAVIPRSLGLEGPSDYVKRYGPQPGSGKAPS